MEQRRPAAAIRGVFQRQIVVTEHGSERRQGLQSLEAFRQRDAVAGQQIEQQTDVVTARESCPCSTSSALISFSAACWA